MEIAGDSSRQHAADIFQKAGSVINRLKENKMVEFVLITVLKAPGGIQANVPLSGPILVGKLPLGKLPLGNLPSIKLPLLVEVSHA